VAAVTLTRALVEGFRGGRAPLAAAAYLYVAALAFAWLAAAPGAAALHGALDGQPSAARMIADGGVDVVEEMSRSGAALWPAASAGVVPLVVVFVLFGVVLSGGANGLAARRSERPFREFWIAGTSRFPSFLLRGVLSAVYAAAAGVVAWGIIAGILRAFAEPSGRGTYWTGVGLILAVVTLTALHVRTVLGFAFARASAEPDERLLRGFVGAVSFCWSRLPATHGIGVLFLALQVVSALSGLALGRLAGWGGWISAGLAQAGWFGVAWLRAAEIRTRVAYASSADPAPLHLAPPEGPEGAGASA
jgi:hypothetical protein